MAAIICFSVITILFYIVTTLLGSKSHAIAKPVKWFHICANAKKQIFAVNYDFCFECLVSPSADKIGTWLLEECYVQ